MFRINYERQKMAFVIKVCCILRRLCSDLSQNDKKVRAWPFLARASPARAQVEPTQSYFQSGVDKQRNQLTLDFMDQNLALCSY